MYKRRQGISIVVGALLVAAMLTSAQVALAVFSKAVTGGPLTLVTATFSAPGGLTATQTNCRTNRSPEIYVDWNATSSSYVTSYTVERATASAGPYTSAGTVTSPETAYTDSSGSLGYSTTYYYRVKAVYHSWSATSTVASVKTLNKSCQ
jgi:hypothetical protein